MDVSGFVNQPLFILFQCFVFAQGGSTLNHLS